MNWTKLRFDADGKVTESTFRDHIVRPLYDLAQTSIELRSAILGLESSYASLFTDGGKSLDLLDLPEKPRFIFNATNLQTGARWGFTRDYVGDWSIGLLYRESNNCPSTRPPISLSAAVAASSAYPPFFSPVYLSLPTDECAWIDPIDLRSGIKPTNRDCGISMNERVLASYRQRVMLMDGGVVDNLGLEPIWQLCGETNVGDPGWHCGEVFISDGGGSFGSTVTPRTNWFSTVRRTIGLMSNEPSALRTETAIHQFQRVSSKCEKGSPRSIRDPAGESDPGQGRIPGAGVYWNIQGTELPSKAQESLREGEWCEVQHLAAEETRLKALDECKIRWLINWGYLATDRALGHLSRHKCLGSPAPELPYPEERFGPGSAASDRCSGISLSCEG